MAILCWAAKNSLRGTQVTLEISEIIYPLELVVKKKRSVRLWIVRHLVYVPNQSMRLPVFILILKVVFGYEL